MTDSDVEDIFLDPVTPTAGPAKFAKLVKLRGKNKKTLEKSTTQLSSVEPSASKKNTDAFQNLPVKCTKSVILDLGTWSLKAGFAGDPRPCCEVPSLVEREPRRRVYKMGFVGKGTAEEPKVNPLHKGVVTDWDALEKLLRHIFDTELHVPIEEHAILLSDPPLSPTSNRERFAEFMFETLSTPAMHIAQQSVLSVYSYGKTTGLVVDCGHGSSHVVPVYNGYQLPGETGRVDYGGQSLNTYLTSLFQNTRQTVSGSCGFNDKLLDDIKRKSCYVPVDTNTDRSPGQVEYSLPDGTTLTLDEEKYLCPEALFQPSLLGSVEPGLPTLIMNSVNRCDIQLKSDILQNILVCGGSTMFRGFPERLQWEMDHLVPMSSATVVAVPERQNAVWLGGSILASLDSFQSLWVQRQDYEERGAFVIYQKCF
ncbi:actin-like protein 7A [Osmerus mordax]|uniref:actin-like protein 7A n=1 Tax=Osmerus mordax TaxID=8014 RepID=UPI00350F56DF